MNRYFTTKANVIGLFLGLILCTAANSGHAALAQSPLFLTVSVDPNVLFNMSVETPMGGAAYNDQADDLPIGDPHHCAGRDSNFGHCYFRTKTYLGYFDPDKCYNYNSSGGFFAPKSDTLNAFHECSGRFSGNFMNWATMTAMDMFVWTMTGGNRVIDQIGNKTVIRRTRRHNNGNWFPHKFVGNFPSLVSPSTVTPWSNGRIFIENTDFGVRFGTTLGGDQKGSMNVKIRVCNKAKTLEDNCVQYSKTNGTKYYKPEGLIQKNADHMRFGLTSYTNTSTREMHGGVLRSNMKYVGTFKPNNLGGVIPNSLHEIKANGTLNLNSNPGDATASGVAMSGVIPFLNRFSDLAYKGFDPTSELFYESIRYYKNLGPTPEHINDATANEIFPILSADRWQDPITESCQKNFIIGINDAFPWNDKRLPGTFFTSANFHGAAIADNDFGEPSNPDPDIDVTALTNQVGALQGLNNTIRRVGCTATNCNVSCGNKLISGLGEVFGTCAATGGGGAGRQNTYYIAGLAYYANTQDIRTGTGGATDFAGKQTISTFMIDTQEFNNNPPLGEINLLWLAGKYGGFHDFNDNGVPDDAVLNGVGQVIVESEWDVDGDNEPDNYVLATSPEKLVRALTKAFDDINGQMSSASAVAANSTQLNTDTQVYQAKFNSNDWTGQLAAFSVDTITGALTPTWEASSLLPAHTNRHIFSYNPTKVAGNRGIQFKWGQLANTTDPAGGTSQKDYLNTLFSVDDGLGQDRVAWLRGSHAKEQKKVGGIFRNRTHAMGDIINSDPLYVAGLDYGYGASGAGSASYASYLTYTATRTPMMYMGANDGMLHGFNANGPLAGGGVEEFAYVPNAIIPELSKLTTLNYAHQYYVDGMSAASDVYNGVAWRTLLTGSTGAGGRAIFTLDVTNPSSFSKSNVRWEYTHHDDSDLGYTLAQPTIARLQNGTWVVIVANGYNSDPGHAVLFILDAFTGALLKKIDTGEGDAASGHKNGLSSPLAVDTDNDRSIDTVYAGDLYGNLWKFDLSGPIANWAVANSGHPFFVACTAAGDGESCADLDRQPITAKPNIGDVGGAGTAQNDIGRMLYFGTGKYIEPIDNIVVAGASQMHSFYGLWDAGNRITNRGSLQEQDIIFEGPITTVDGLNSAHPVRAVSDNPVCYTATSPNCTASSAPFKKGWVLNLVPPNNITIGERSISQPLVRRGFVIFSTAIPELDPCSFGGTSWLMELDALTGGRHTSPPFDVNGDGIVDGDDYIDIGIDIDGDGIDDPIIASGVNQEIGITKTPAVVEAQDVDFKYSSGSTGNMGTVVDGIPPSPPPPSVPGIRRAWHQLQ